MTTNDNNRRRKYEKPSMKVYELPSCSMILAGSGELGGRGTYDPSDVNPFSDDEY